MTYRGLFAEYDRLTQDATFAAIASHFYAEQGGTSALAFMWRDVAANLTKKAVTVRKHVTQLEQLGI